MTPGQNGLTENHISPRKGQQRIWNASGVAGVTSMFQLRYESKGLIHNV